MREREGASLEADLRANAAAVAKEAARIGKRMPKVVREHHKKLRQRVQELLGGQSKLGPAELPRELALLADRMDVGEELARLSSHLGQWSELLDEGRRDRAPARLPGAGAAARGQHDRLEVQRRRRSRTPWSRSRRASSACASRCRTWSRAWASADAWS